MLHRSLAALYLLTPLSVAAAAPLIQSLDLDGAVDVRSDPNGDLVVRRGDTEVGRIAGAGALAGLTLTREEAGNQPLLSVRGRRGVQAWLVLAALHGQHLTVLHDGPVGPIGHDSEYAVTVTVDKTSVSRYQTAPGTARCDGEARLFREAYDPVSGWRAQPPPLPAGLARGAIPEAVSTRMHAMLPIFPFTAASAQAGVSRADQLTPPRELDDGRAETVWRVSGDASGTWVTARTDSPGRRIRSLLLVPPMARSTVRAPRTLLAVFADGSGVRFDLLPGPEPQRVTFPEPVAASCISLVVVAGAPHGADTGLAEVHIESDLDVQGPRGLVQLASGDGPAAEAAARALSLLPDAQSGEIMAMLSEALPAARAAGRARLMAFLSTRITHLPENCRQSAASLLRRLLSTAAPRERAKLWQLLDRVGPYGEQLLRALAQEPGQQETVRAEALLRLGRRGDVDSFQALLAIYQEPRLQRAATLALATTLRCHGVADPRWTLAFAALVRATGGDTHQPLRAAALAAAIGKAGADCIDPALQREVAAALVAAWPRDPNQDFVLALGLVRALAGLTTTSPGSRMLLKRILEDRSIDPILRRAAAHGAGNKEFARLGLSDADPGVRMAALEALTGQQDPTTVVALEQTLASDVWPQVRRVAVVARAAACTTPSTNTRALRQAIHDPDDTVQRLALVGVSRCEGTGAAGLLAEIAQREDASPNIRSTACGLLGTTGSAALSTLTRVLADMLTAPTPEESYLTMTLNCTRAFGAVASPGDTAVLLPAFATAVPASLRLSTVQAISQTCRRAGSLPSSVQTGLTDLQHDEDGRLRAAASRAVGLCGPR